MKPRLIILSDLWGAHQASWVEGYIHQLAHVFEVTFYDCCQLGRLDVSQMEEASLHQQFVAFGIQQAVDKLFEIEKGELRILGFSVGGAIGWKFALQNPNVKTLFAISSTRLRSETARPDAEIELFFGDEDTYRPQPEWFSNFGLPMNIENQVGHGLYKDAGFITLFCNRLLVQHANSNKPIP